MRLLSPIFFAADLKGALLICHGTIDDNVPFQAPVLLIKRLIELLRENWDLAIHLAEPHKLDQ